MKQIPISKAKARSFILLVLLLAAGTLLISCSGQKTIEPGETYTQEQGLHVPEGFTITRAAPAGMVSHPYFATFDFAGRLFVIESSGKTNSTEDVLKNPDFKVLLLEDLDGDGVFDRRKVFADRIPYPMGSYFYRGSLYVTAPPDLLRFTDTDADGVADRREVILTGWTLNHNAATLSGPFFGPDGWMYMCDARRGFDISTKEGTELKGKGARIWRCRPDGSALEWVSAGGFDNTIELIFMPSGETIGTMTYFTDPRNGFRDALMHWVEGGVYPKSHLTIEEDELILTGDLMPVMTTLPRVSPAGLMRYRSSVFGEAFDGNLFSAQFNTGRVMRHTITAKGATYETSEEAFMTSESLDGHPTDVLEDADGSLLVVNTGGWFIAGCPLSVVAKTDIDGGLFRIRRTDAHPIEDPRGKNIDFTSLSPDELTGLIKDPRPVVHDKAIEQLVIKGEGSVASLRRIVVSSDRAEDRIAAVFALYRIQTSAAMEGVLSALDDKSMLVRTAAARASGLARERKAVDKLLKLVETDSLPVKRQAATALGQIGDDRATGPLLAASENAEDRFVEHAILYAIITLGKKETVIAGLKNTSDNVRRSALIVLDQMKDAPLKEADLLPFLSSKNPALQDAGIWVASHHPEWSEVVIGYLNRNFKSPHLTEAREKALTNLMVRFIGGAPLQKFVALKLEDPLTSSFTKLFLLNAIRQSPEEDLPGIWVQLLGNLLNSGSPEIRSAALDIVQSRNPAGLDKVLERIAGDDQMPSGFRIKALGARIASQAQLSDTEFKMILQFMEPAYDLPARQAAARLLVQAKLTNQQLLTLAKEEVPKADGFLLPALTDCFEQSEDEEVGKTFVAALPVSPDRLDNLSEERLEKILNRYPSSVGESAQTLLKTLIERQGSRLAELEKFQAALRTGDVGEGRKLFYGKATCSICHSVVDQGGKFGPDLTNIGEIRSQHDILEAILYPSASFAREYETSKVVTQTTTYSGIIKEESGETILMETGPALSVRISRRDITSVEPQTASMMPQGLSTQLSIQEMSDLMAFLTTLPDGLGHLMR